MLALGAAPSKQKSPTAHEHDSKVPKKYVPRLLFAAERLGLCSVVGDPRKRAGAKITLPIAISPPRNVCWPQWGGELGARDGVPKYVRDRVFDAGKPNLRLLGTSFWPDVEVTEGTTRLAAIEVKLIRSQQPASKAIAEAIGQSIIYSIRYPHVFTFLVH